MKLPHIEPIHGLDALIDLFSDPAAFAAKLREWQDYEARVNKKLDAVSDLSEIETLRSQATALMAEAREHTRVVTDGRAALQRDVEAAVQQRQVALDDLRTREAELDMREAVLARLKAGVEVAQAQAHDAAMNAATARQDYEHRAAAAAEAEADHRAKLDEVRATLARLGG